MNKGPRLVPRAFCYSTVIFSVLSLACTASCMVLVMSVGLAPTALLSVLMAAVCAVSMVLSSAMSHRVWMTPSKRFLPSLPLAW